jgi:hypothetical protein
MWHYQLLVRVKMSPSFFLLRSNARLTKCIESDCRVV